MERGRGSRRRRYVNVSGSASRGNASNAVSRSREEMSRNLPDKWDPHGYGPEHVLQVGTTNVEIDELAFLWTLSSYSVLSSTNPIVWSPKFSGVAKPQLSWQLKLFPKKVVGAQEYVSVFLMLSDLGEGNSSDRKQKTVKAKFEIAAVDAEGRVVKRCGGSTMDICGFKKLGTWGFEEFISLAELHSPSNRLLENDELKFYIRMWVYGDWKHRVINGGAANPSPGDEERRKRGRECLASDLKQLYKSTTFADVLIATKIKTFYVHKAVLAARSAVFSAMLCADMLERKLSKVEIFDFEHEIVEAMFEYIYTGETGLLKKRAPELLQIAEKYDLSGLKEESERLIADNLTVENCADALVLADIYSADILKASAVEFININKKDVEKAGSFQRMRQSHAKLFVDLYMSL